MLLDSPEQLAAAASLGPRETAALTRGARVITDDHTWIEFTSPKWFQHPTLFNLERIASHRRSLPPDAGAQERLAYESYGAILAETVAESNGEAIAILERALVRDPLSRELRVRLDARRGVHPTGAGL